MLDRVKSPRSEKWFVTISLVQVPSKDELNVWTYTEHIYVGSTANGGLAPCLAQIAGKSVPMWKERPVDDPSSGEHGNWEEEKSLPHGIEDEGKDILRASCQCGGVTFASTRSDTIDGPLQHCACNSWRLTSSSFITSWMSLPASVIDIKNDLALPKTLSVGLGNPYTTSRGILRTFCRVCGASVSYRRGDSPDVVIVAAGLLQKGDLRAGTLDEWDHDLTHAEEAQSDALLKAISEYLGSATRRTSHKLIQEA